MPSPKDRRQLRSNSLTSAGENGLEDIKKMIFETREILQRDLNDVKDILSAFSSRIEAIETAISKIQSDHLVLKGEITTLKKDSEELRTGMVEDCMVEAKNRMVRLNNVVISGLREEENGTVEERKCFDELQVKEIMQEIGVSEVVTSDCWRIGRRKDNGSRLLKLRVENFQRKSEILSKSKCLKNSRSYSKVYIRPDRTPMEQEKERQLQEELMRRKHHGEDVVLFKGRVRARSDIQNFHRRIL